MHGNIPCEGWHWLHSHGCLWVPTPWYWLLWGGGQCRWQNREWAMGEEGIVEATCQSIHWDWDANMKRQATYMCMRGQMSEWWRGWTSKERQRLTWHVALPVCTGDRRGVTRFIRRLKVWNLWFRFHQSLNTNLPMGSRSEDLMDQTLNHQLDSGSNPVLKVRELDYGQSTNVTLLHSGSIVADVKWVDVSWDFSIVGVACFNVEVHCVQFLQD